MHDYMLKEYKYLSYASMKRIFKAIVFFYSVIHVFPSIVIMIAI